MLIKMGLPLFLVLALAAPVAHAQISNSMWGQGGIRIGDAPATTCNAAAEGTVKYNDTTNVHQFCNGSAWANIGSGSAAGSDRQIQFNSAGLFSATTNFVYTSAGRLGLGTASPSQRLHVVGNIHTTGNITGDGGGDSVSGFWDIIATGGRIDGNSLTMQASNGFRSINYPGETGIFFPNDAGYPASAYSNIDLQTVNRGGYIQITNDGGSIRFTSAGRLGIGTSSPQSALHVPDAKYFQAADNNAGAPPAGDCDADAERGRQSIDTTNNRLYICNGATRGWDYVALTN